MTSKIQLLIMSAGIILYPILLKLRGIVTQAIDEYLARKTNLYSQPGIYTLNCEKPIEIRAQKSYPSMSLNQLH